MTWTELQNREILTENKRKRRFGRKLEKKGKHDCGMENDRPTLKKMK